MIKYLTIDNFLHNDHFDMLCNLDLKTKVKSENQRIYSNKILNDGRVESSCLSESNIREFFNTYHKKLINILIDLYPEKVSLYEWTRIDIIETGANHKFIIHDDDIDVLLSGVIYLKPERNLGTIFYDNKKGDNKTVVPWKQNRALFFSRREKESWHSFMSDGHNNRFVLVYNLMTNNVRKACEIEGVNYYKSKFRHVVNPYLYRYLNFTI